MTSVDTDLFDIPTAARSLGSSESAVRKAIARGTLRARAVDRGRGAKWMIPADEVARYLRDHRTPRKAKAKR